MSELCSVPLLPFPNCCLMPQKRMLPDFAVCGLAVRGLNVLQRRNHRDNFKIHCRKISNSQHQTDVL